MGTHVVKKCKTKVGVTEGGESSAGSKYTADVPVILEEGKSFGKYVNGDIILAKGKDKQELLELMAQETLIPAITITAITNQREVGGDNSVTINFTVTKGSLPITGITIAGEVVTPTGETQSGSVTVTTTTTYGLRTFAGSVTDGTNTINGSTSVRYSYKIFAGASELGVVRNLPVSVYDTENSITYPTGTTYTLFVVALPPTKTLISIIDLTNAQNDITNSFESVEIQILDAGGNPVTYTVWYTNSAIPYDPSANHKCNFIDTP